MPTPLTALQVQALEHAEACERMAVKGVSHPMNDCDSAYYRRLKKQYGLSTTDRELVSWLKNVQAEERKARGGINPFFGKVYWGYKYDRRTARPVRT